MPPAPEVLRGTSETVPVLREKRAWCVFVLRLATGVIDGSVKKCSGHMCTLRLPNMWALGCLVSLLWPSCRSETTGSYFYQR